LKGVPSASTSTGSRAWLPGSQGTFLIAHVVPYFLKNLSITACSCPLDLLQQVAVRYLFLLITSCRERRAHAGSAVAFTVCVNRCRTCFLQLVIHRGGLQRRLVDQESKCRN
jgi:hypothetical protein